MSRILEHEGWLAVSRPETADALIVNTCGFIEPAIRESIDAILDLADFKQPEGSGRFLVVTGCLSQRFKHEILEQMPEVDAILGTADYGSIAELLERLDSGGRSWPDPGNPGNPGSLRHLGVDRQPSTPRPYAWVKIAEGCSHSCSFCTIPKLRGPYRSRPVEALVEEASRLSSLGYTELILIAQDTGRYGMDLYGERRLPELVSQLCRIPEVKRIRLLYVYSDGVTDALIDVMKSEPKVAHYLDIPIQHASDRILARMNRQERSGEIRKKINKLRSAMPDIILRSTVMVGFPGETDEDFRMLTEFIHEIAFERLGCFVYSPEEGTRAARMKPRVEPEKARDRYHEIMERQHDIAIASARRRIGTTVRVTFESVDDRGIVYVGRSYGEAPDVDPVIKVESTEPGSWLGKECLIRLVDIDEYDMIGVIVP